jgi:hypothetical protein
MVDHKQLSLLTAAILAAGLALAHPARSLAIEAQPALVGVDQGRVALVKPVSHRQGHRYRSGRCDGRRGEARRSCKPRYKSGYYRYRQRTGYYKPWEGIQLCTNCPAFK